MLSRAIQCKQAVYTSILNKVGNGRRIYVCAWPRPLRSAWVENIANAWLPIQTYMGILQRAVTLILMCELKFHPVKPVTLTHSACPYKNYVRKCSQILHELDYKSFFVFSYLVYNYLVFNLSLRLIVKKECFDLALKWAITGVFFRGHFRSLITRA